MGSTTRLSTLFGTGGGSLRRRLRAAILDESGVSATEFALIAPLLVFSLLATADVGLALSERLTLGHILRAGAQSATEDAGTDKIDLFLRTTAAKNMSVAVADSTDLGNPVTLSVRQFCACAEQPSVELACSTTCAQNAPTQVFYLLTGQKTYSGILLPAFTQTKSLKVQVR